MRRAINLIFIFLLVFVLPLQLVGAENRSHAGSSGFEITVWTSQEVYTPGECAIACFNFPTVATSAELVWHGIGSADASLYKETLSCGRNGIGQAVLFNSTIQKIGTWIIELTVFVSLQEYNASCKFYVVRENTLTDNFEYADLNEMWQENGWYASPWDYVPFNQSQLLSISNGNLTMENNQTAGYSRIRHNVETPLFGSSSVDILDWEVKAKAIWTGRETGGLTLSAWVKQTETQPVYCYVFIFGYTGISLKRDEQLLYYDKNWQLSRDLLYEFSFQRKGSTFYFYINESLAGSYDDHNVIPTSITDFGIGVGWDCIASYNYSSFRIINSFGLQLFSEYGSPQGSAMYREGEQTMINVTSPVNLDANTSCTFLSWTDTSSGDEVLGNPALITIDKPISLAARWLLTHTGDLTLAGDDRKTMQNCEYRENGNIRLSGNASFVLMNASLILVQDYTLQYSIEACQNAGISINNGNLTSNEVFQLRCYGNACLTLANAVASCVYIYGHDASSIDIRNSNISQCASLNSRNTSKALIDGSDVAQMICTDESQVIVNQSTLKELCVDVSGMNLSLANLQSGRLVRWNLDQNAIVTKGKKNINLTDTEVVNWSIIVGGSETSLLIKNSTLKSIGMNFGGQSSVALHDLPRGTVDSWDLRNSQNKGQLSIDLTLESVFVAELQLISYGNATVSVENSTVNGVEADETSHIDILNCVTEDIHCWNFSSLHLANSTVDGNLFFWEGSTSMILNSIVASDLMCYDNSYVQLVDSTVVSSLQCWGNSELCMINADLSSKLQVHDQSLAKVKWSLSASVIANGFPLQNAEVQARVSNGSIVESALTDQQGSAVMNLTEREIRSINGSAVNNTVRDYSILVSEPDINQTQNDRLVFVNWTGDFESEDKSVSISALKQIRLVARYKIQHMLSVTSMYGQTNGSGWYDEGSYANYSLTQELIPYENGTERRFTSYIGDVNDTRAYGSILIDRAKTLSAQWTTQYFLSLKSEHMTVSGTGWYDEGTNATFSLSSDTCDFFNGTRLTFEQWEGDTSTFLPSESAPVGYVLMTQPFNATAKWIREYRLTITNNTGTHQEWIAEGAQAQFSSAEVIIDPLLIHYFRNWSGDFNGSSPAGTILMSSTYAISANWEISFGIFPIVAVLVMGALASFLIMKKMKRTFRAGFISVTVVALLCTLIPIIIPTLRGFSVTPASSICLAVCGVAPASVVALTLYKGGATRRFGLSKVGVCAVLCMVPVTILAIYNQLVLMIIMSFVAILDFAISNEDRLTNRSKSSRRVKMSRTTKK